MLDLEEIVRYIARSDPIAAEKIRTGVLAHVEILATFPLIGPLYARDRHGLTREIVFRKLRIFYHVKEEQNEVFILCVWHGSRDEPRLPTLP